MYKLSPYKLIWCGDYYYVLGYSEKQRKVINFRVDRIALRPDDSERSYSKEELAQMFASVEWQADTMGASLLMPRRIIENALAKYNQSNPIKVYGDNTITSKDKAVIRRMAAYIGVSYTVLVIRLRDMGLFEYHNILEYISNELNLGGVSQ